MKTNTFILIVTAYSLLLGLPAIFAPGYSVEYFGGDATDLHQISTMTFVGGYQLAMGFLGYIAYRSTDKATKRGWLLSIAFLTFFAIVVYIYNLNIRHMEPHKTLYLDSGIWLILGISALYFWNKEK
jgi:Na+/melibiose symporter-like transporter